MKIILTDQFEARAFVTNRPGTLKFYSQFSFEEITEDNAKTLLSLASDIINHLCSHNMKELFLSVRLERRLENYTKILDVKDAIILLAEFDVPFVMTASDILDKPITWWKICYVD